MLARCKECGKEYELDRGENPSDYQCECGGKLNYNENTTVDSAKKVYSKFTNKIKSEVDYISENNKKMEAAYKKKLRDQNRLIKCPLCNHDLSSNAVVCLNCGNHTKRKVEDQAWILIALVLPFIGFLAGTYFGVKERKGWMGIIVFSVIGVIFYIVLVYVTIGTLLFGYY